MNSYVKTSRSGNWCGLCNENSSKYCCPRCEIFYCSLECYKSEKHIECSESFYRDCVNQELASQQVDDESKKKMIDILKRMQEENVDNERMDELLEGLDDGSVDSDDCDEDDIDLEQRIKGLNLDDADAIWNALTQDEKNEFEALLNQGEISSVIPQWEPWWTFYREPKIIENLSDKDSIMKDEEVALKKCPILKDVPKFGLITPSPAVKFNIINVLAAYVFAMRYFNGETENQEGSTYFMNICANMDTNTNFNDLATAVTSVAQNCLQSQLIQTDEESLEVMKHDTFLIIRGPSKENKSYYCRAALSHLYRILSQAKSSSKTPNVEKHSHNNEFRKKFPDHKSEHLPNLDSNKVKKCVKKVEYYLSYINSYGLVFD